ncbi:MAG TPA: DUF4175 family protein [Planctomycetota bacterium]|nr:DUF4175 family protein [Planctomycetota bacterium]
MRTPSFLLFALLCALALPAGGQEPEPRSVLQRLATRQKRAAQQLNDLLQKMDVLKGDLRRRNETEKADVLDRVRAIILQQKIQAGGVKGSEKTELMLVNLQRAMDQMAHTLEERPDATEEVQKLGQGVVDTLEEILRVLMGPDDIKELGEREAALRDARAEADKLARDQRELHEQTRNSMPATAAEEAAQKGARELDRLAKQIADLDKRAANDLKEIDEARERVTRLTDLLTREQRLRQETGLRSGESDALTPQTNRALAELEALAREARDAEATANAEDARGEMARAVDSLARRQDAVAKEIGAREALERARDAEGPAKAKEEIEKAASLAPESEADALRRIAEAVGNESMSRERAREAIEAALARMPSKETLARDEQSVAREAENTAAQAPAAAETSMKEAAAEAAKAAENLQGEGPAESAARRSADALRRAHEALAGKPTESKGPAAGEDRKAEAAAKRAEDLAAALKALAQDPKAKEAGLATAADAAQASAERAAQELKAAAEAAREGQARRAEELARAAAERAERSMRELTSAARPSEDLAGRQGLVADDLKSLAQRPGEAQRDALKEAADHAAAAREEIRGDNPGAAQEHQDEVIRQLDKLVEQAKAAAEATAQENADALKRIEASTEAAAQRAEEIGKGLGEGARSAKEVDARGRLEDAAERTKEAAEALRRSLRRLQQGLPKSAEQDRKEADEKVEAAKRSLDGLRESHSNPSAGAREAMKKIAERQADLEDAVKKLEQRLRRQDQQPGVDSLQDAQAAMRQARQALDQGDPDEAERAQERAEKALEEAQQELGKEERRYRQLRQHELLYKLKEELRNFRRAAQGHREMLMAIEAEVKKRGRVTRDIRKGDLKQLIDQVSALQRDVAEKATAVEGEGAVVYTYILKGCSSDLKETAAQLEMSEVGLLPQELLGDVVRRFDLAIKGLEHDIQDRQQQEQQQQQQGGERPTDVQNKPVLVPADAEIRMMLVLQQSLNQEREAFFANRPDFGKEAMPDIDRQRIERMYHQQGSLAELFDSLSQSLFGSHEEQPLGPAGGDEGPGGEGQGQGQGQGPGNAGDATPPEGGDAPPGGADGDGGAGNGTEQEGGR